jgi:hypothetical protein
MKRPHLQTSLQTKLEESEDHEVYVTPIAGLQIKLDNDTAGNF